VNFSKSHYLSGLVLQPGTEPDVVTTDSRIATAGQAADPHVWLSTLASYGRSETDIELLEQVVQFRLQEAGRAIDRETVSDALAVADILIELQADRETLAAGLLHDFGRLDDKLLQAIRDHFGQAIAGLVDAVARMDILPEKDQGDVSADSHIDAEKLRKMLLAMVEDVRVVLIKLADRLHQLRKLKGDSLSRQRRIARQTLDIFAPLANRLGIWQIKWQLEDLSLRYLEPEDYHRIANSLDERRVDREMYIEEFMQTLESELHRAGIKGEISGRVKHIYSIYRKMKRKNVDIGQIFDVRAVRVLVDTIPDCYAALGIAHSLWPYIREEFDDYITSPKSNNYQSIHTAVHGPQGKVVEIQIRTHAMHDRCELGVASHWRYKEGVGHDESFDRKIAWLRQLLEWKDEVADASDFVAEFRSQLFEDRVYVFSPAGKIVDLPHGSTPIDFAYAIHSEVGHRCRGAKVNDVIVPLTYALKTGDRVEILTVKQGQPSRDWINPHLGYVASQRARSRIQQWFRQQDYEQNVTDGRSLLDKELTRLGIRDVNIEKLAQRLKFDKVSDMAVALGRGDLRSSQIANALQVDLKPKPARAELTLRETPVRRATSDVQVLGVGSLMTHMAKCCKPLPGDDIVGYITRGRGVSVHRSDCRNILHARSRQDNRLIEVSWGDPEREVYPVDIQVIAYDRKGLLHDITALLSNEKINVTAVNTSSDARRNEASMSMTIEISDLGRLSRLLDRINALPNVQQARRIG
jgi:GTP pyrophosphokinase